MECSINAFRGFGLDARVRFIALPLIDWVTLSLMLVNLILLIFETDMINYTYVIGANEMMCENP